MAGSDRKSEITGGKTDTDSYTLYLKKLTEFAQLLESNNAMMAELTKLALIVTDADIGSSSYTQMQGIQNYFDANIKPVQLDKFTKGAVSTDNKMIADYEKDPKIPDRFLDPEIADLDDKIKKALIQKIISFQKTPKDPEIIPDKKLYECKGYEEVLALLNKKAKELYHTTKPTHPFIKSLVDHDWGEFKPFIKIQQRKFVPTHFSTDFVILENAARKVLIEKMRKRHIESRDLDIGIELKEMDSYSDKSRELQNLYAILINQLKIDAGTKAAAIAQAAKQSTDKFHEMSNRYTSGNSQVISHAIAQDFKEPEDYIKKYLLITAGSFAMRSDSEIALVKTALDGNKNQIRALNDSLKTKVENLQPTDEKKRVSLADIQVGLTAKIADMKEAQQIAATVKNCSDIEEKFVAHVKQALKPRIEGAKRIEELMRAIQAVRAQTTGRASIASALGGAFSDSKKIGKLDDAIKTATLNLDKIIDPFVHIQNAKEREKAITEAFFNFKTTGKSIKERLNKLDSGLFKQIQIMLEPQDKKASHAPGGLAAS